MHSEPQTVSDCQYVLRRIHCNHFDPNAEVPVQRAAFCPTDEDVDGLSVSFADEVTAVELASSGRRPATEYYVVRLRVSDLASLGLSVVPDPDSQAPVGHALIPELSREMYRADKKRLKNVQLQLMAIASNAIVWRPEDAQSQE